MPYPEAASREGGRLVSGGGHVSEHRQVVARVLSGIPTNEEQPQTISQIAYTVGQSFDDLPVEYVESIVTSVIVLLNAFDVLSEGGGGYRCRGEMPMYFTRSLAWYIASARPLVNNWMRRGVGDDLSINALLDAAPYVLRLMEAKRLRLSGSGVEPTRRRRVACVLVKTVVDGQAYFLFEWDRAAAQYQLIGGRIDKDEEPEAAATQEFIEEMVIEPGQRLEHGRDFEVRALNWDRPPPLEWTGVSRTVGAVTRYEVWAYGAYLKMEQLRLGERYHWLSKDEMLAGETNSGRRTGDPSLFRIMNASMAGGLEQAPLSIRNEAILGFPSYVDSATDGRIRVFIGHGRSPAWRELADHLRDHHGYRVITFESEPRIGQAITVVLARMIAEASFAILVHTAEDEQSDGGLRARQNVVHETGLFQGRLGFSRAIIVRQRGCDDFSNLAGLQELHYSDEIRETFGEVVAVLRREFG